MEHHLKVERLPFIDLGEVLDGDQEAELEDGEVSQLGGARVGGLQHARRLGCTPKMLHIPWPRGSGRLVSKNMTIELLTMMSMIITMISLITDYDLGSGQDA